MVSMYEWISYLPKGLTPTAFSQKTSTAFVVLQAQLWPQPQSAQTSYLPVPDTSLRCWAAVLTAGGNPHP